MYFSTNDRFTVTLYNGMAHSFKDYLVRIPVNLKEAIVVDSEGHTIKSAVD